MTNPFTPKHKQKTLIELPSDKEETTLPMGSIQLDNDDFGKCSHLDTFGYANSKPSAQIKEEVIKGKYKIIGMLGEGGASIVYLCERLLVKDQVALKILLPELSREPAKVKRFHFEAITTASIKHPNVITIHDFDYTEKKVPFIVVELLKGQTLHGEMKQHKQMKLERIVEILTPICSALNVAHTKGIIHRDLKPSNIVLHRVDDGEEVVKVIDFGIAKSLIGEDKVHTGPGMVFGTPSYMSPEHCLGDVIIDGRADVYSLGVLLFEMLTGTLPFQADKPTKLMLKHVREQPPSPKNFCPNISDEMELIILKSLSKNPGGRFSNTLEFAQALKQTLISSSKAYK